LVIGAVDLSKFTSPKSLMSPLWVSKWRLSCKRAIDIIIAATSLILLSPLLAIIAIAVKVSSPGPILFRWRVVGKGGKPLEAFKFRSMYRDAEERKARLLALNEMQGPVFKITNDPRITRVGRWLRKYSLDELPQLWSVFKGDLSLVGPRPPLQSEYIGFTERQKLKLSVKPGITCLWQVGGRNQISDFDEWIRLDLLYIQQWSLGLDFRILLRTTAAVLSGTGK
jgi:lipopolysaccharide/colanic/teichoic acid biosynthesis glycosyltransferase